MKINNKFEIPYNFDLALIDILSILDPEGKTIDCIYIPPFIKDYQTILRSAEQAEFLTLLDRKEYEEHIKYINEKFPNKIQLLLQKTDENEIMDSLKILYYIHLGFKNFCVGNKRQAQIIKNIDQTLTITGSISMNISINNLLNEDFKNFDNFVLPFNFCKNFDLILQLPKKYKYILLVNAYCNVNCKGSHHWFSNYNEDENEDVFCPGILGRENLKWSQTTRIRPMDLELFKPYISIFKIQDRGWPTEEIIRDYILYTSDFSYYPGIEYSFDFYRKE